MGLQVCVNLSLKWNSVVIAFLKFSNFLLLHNESASMVTVCKRSFSRIYVKLTHKRNINKREIFVILYIQTPVKCFNYFPRHIFDIGSRVVTLQYLRELILFLKILFTWYKISDPRKLYNFLIKAFFLML